LLDAGCHDAASTAAFATRADLAVGIDLDVIALARGRPAHGSARVAAADVAALPFRDATFDCIVFSEVLEHVAPADEPRSMAELQRVLQPGGTLILTTPHRGAFWWLDPLLFKTHLGRLRAVLRGHHLDVKGHKHYTVAEVRALLEPHFEIDAVHRVGRLLYPLAYWGYLLPFGIGQRPVLVRLWQAMMDFDYSRERGDAAYNVCIIARARGAPGEEAACASG
jgi:SAM-dependent methyltransferase